MAPVPGKLPIRTERGVVAARWLLLLTLGALMAGLVAVERAEPPPAWLRTRSCHGLDTVCYARAHLLSVGAVTALLTAMPLLVWWLERRDRTHQILDERRHLRDRAVMLARVRHKWIDGVLDSSLGEAARLELGLAYCPTVLAHTGRLGWRHGSNIQPLPAGTTVTDVFDKLGGTLLILGEPGAGKTTALLELANALLERAETDERQPIPVVVNLASWPRRRTPLVAWLLDELHTSYQVPRQIGQAWLAGGELLPLLDGLDEVRVGDRSACAAAVSAFCREQGLVRLVVCCRTVEYHALGVRLGVDEAVELQPPTRRQVYDYLEEVGTPLADVRAVLEDATDEVWTFIRSPLVLSIVTLAYRDRPAEALRGQRSLDERRDRLFGAYTVRMLERRPMAVRWSPEKMLRWLVWLARSMREHSLSEFHLDRLSSEWLSTKTQQRLVAVGVGLLAWLAVGLFAGLAVGLFVGLVAGLVAAVVAWLVIGLPFGAGVALGSSRIMPVESVGWSWAAVRKGKSVVIAFALLFGLVFGLVGGSDTGLFAGLGAVLGSGLAIALATGLTSTMVDERTIPNEGIHRSARYALMIGIGAGLTSALTVGLGLDLGLGLAEIRTGLGAGLMAELIAQLTSKLLFGLVVGLAIAPVAGLVYGGLACLLHIALRVLLASKGYAPWRYVRFLNSAAELLLLRRAGSAHLFTHRMLLEYLADLDVGQGDPVTQR
jgi:DNA polymerase III delta prime subunit